MAASSELVRELARDRSRPFGLTDPPEKVRNETAASLRESIARLADKSPDDLEAYKAVVLGVADAVAAAKGGGVSAVESEMIGEVRAALGQVRVRQDLIDRAGRVGLAAEQHQPIHGPADGDLGGHGTDILECGL